ncbi:MAG: hypothetical protein ABIG42_02390 [bacterium]
MRYVDFRDKILIELSKSDSGLTWKELKERLSLPYSQPCPEWVKRIELESGLVRTRGSGKAYVWSVKHCSGTGRKQG